MCVQRGSGDEISRCGRLLGGDGQRVSPSINLKRGADAFVRSAQ